MFWPLLYLIRVATLHNIAIYGFGQVGKSLYNKLARNGGSKLKYIVTKNPREIDRTIFTTDLYRPIFDEEVHTIFECISDPESAYLVIIEAIKHNKNIISCSKEVWAKRSKDIIDHTHSYSGKILLNSLACDQTGHSAYPDKIGIENILEIDPKDLYRFRGCGSNEAAIGMLNDFIELRRILGF